MICPFLLQFFSLFIFFEIKFTKQRENRIEKETKRGVEGREKEIKTREGGTTGERRKVQLMTPDSFDCASLR